MVTHASPGGDAGRTPPRRVLITGAAERVGRVLAEHFARQGACVTINHWGQEEEAERAVRAIRAAGGTADAVEADVGDPAACRRLVEETVRRHGGIDVLVHNASTFSQGSVFDVTPEEFERVLSVNLTGPFFLSQAAAEQMLPRGGGKIVTILGNSLYEAWPDFAIHAISKAALARMTELLAVAFSPHVQCIGIAPAEMLQTGDPSKDDSAKVVEGVELVPGSPQALAEMAWQVVLSPAYLNGAVIPLDGGKRLL